MVERDRGINSNIIHSLFQIAVKATIPNFKGVGDYQKPVFVRASFFSLYGWLYILLFLIALVGALHGNIRIGKVALIVWGIIQTMAFTSIPQRQEFTPFLNYPTLQKKLIPTKKYSNSKQTPNFTFSGVKLGACFVKY